MFDLVTREGPQAFIRRHVIGWCAASKLWLAHSPQILYYISLAKDLPIVSAKYVVTEE